MKIWIPGTTDTGDQGTIHSTVTNTNVTIAANGKLGNCLYFNNKGVLIGSPSPLSNNTDDWTFACWMKVNTAHNGCLFSDRTTTDLTGITIFYYKTQWIIDDGVRWQFTPTNTIAVNTWYHVCVVRKKGVGKYLYINGDLDKSTTTTGTPSIVSTTNYAIGNSQSAPTTVTGNQFNGYLNDIRVYDRALSEQEIKKLSQGLVIHLPLSRKGFGMDNIVQNTATPLIAPSQSSYTSRNLVQYRSPSLTAKEILLRACDEGLTLSYDVHCPGIYPDPNISLNRVGCYEGYTIKDNTTGTSKAFYGHHSMNGVATSKNTLGKNNSLNGVSSSATANNPDTSFNGHYSRTIWPKENATVLAFYNNPDNYTVTTGNINVEIRGFVKEESWIKNVHLEFGDKETPWSPHSNDAIYSQMGLDDNIHKDISGYQHNATATGTLTYNTDTPINNLCTHIGATNTKIHISGLNVSGFSNSYSFAWWGKRTSNSPMFWGFSDGCRLNGMYLGNLWNTGDGSNNPLYNIGTTTKVTVPSVNVWHHYVMTGNGTKCYVYLDGELWAEAKTYKSISGTSIYINGWDASTSYTSTNTDIVDFRIYATALDADDVRDLYEKR